LNDCFRSKTDIEECPVLAAKAEVITLGLSGFMSSATLDRGASRKRISIRLVPIWLVMALIQRASGTPGRTVSAGLGRLN
jgi:hypothetical protein